MYMFHRGETDGVGGNTVYWSQRMRDASGWTTNGDVPDASAQYRPAASSFGDSHLVLVHNGDIDHALYWHVCNIDANYKWNSKGKIGNSIGAYYGQALWPYQGKLWMVFVDKDKKIRWATLSSV